MRARLCAFGLLVGACAPAVTAETAERAWAVCASAEGAHETRVRACSTVIAFPGTTEERRAAALVRRGVTRFELGELTRAVADLGRALRVDSANAQAYLERGGIHQARGAFELALRDFNSALALQPNLETALSRRNEALQGRTRLYQGQLERLSELLSSAPADASLLNNRCWLRVTNGDDLDQALTDCNAALLSDPASAATLDSRGLVHLKRGDYAAALTDYEAALKLEPERGHYLYGRGLTRIALGMTSEGQADLQAAEELEPGVGHLYAEYRAPGAH
jgi:tetratricopeptide (TPR) repeat protein